MKILSHMWANGVKLGLPFLVVAAEQLQKPLEAYLVLCITKVLKNLEIQEIVMQMIITIWRAALEFSFPWLMKSAWDRVTLSLSIIQYVVLNMKFFHS